MWCLIVVCDECTTCIIRALYQWVRIMLTSCYTTDHQLTSIPVKLTLKYTGYMQCHQVGMLKYFLVLIWKINMSRSLILRNWRLGLFILSLSYKRKYTYIKLRIYISKILLVEVPVTVWNYFTAKYTRITTSFKEWKIYIIRIVFLQNTAWI